MEIFEGSFERIVDQLKPRFLTAEAVEVGEWQSQDVRDRPEMVTHELQDVVVTVHPPEAQEQWVYQVNPNLPWAEDHFLERVSGLSLNPPPSHEWWPFAREGNAEHTDDGKFAHTYPERMWPKWTNRALPDDPGILLKPNTGLRYPLGDLNDLVAKLNHSPLTRQAYLPIWFPEDTGKSDIRVPCTLGYHFMLRPVMPGSTDLVMNCTYYMRSCDYMRHFRDDVYMAGRLMQWIAGQLDHDVFMGQLNMVIASFHIFAGDLPMLRLKGCPGGISKR